MANKKKPMSTGTLFFLALLVFALFGAGTYILVNSRSKQAPPVVATPTPPPDVQVQTKPESITYKIFLPKVAGNNTVYLEPIAGTTDAKDGILDVAVDALLSSKKESGTVQVIPEGTKRLSPVTVKDGIATINLSKEFAVNFSGGEDQEVFAVGAIAHTLAGNSGGKVKSVLILVDGKPISSLGGHFDLKVPVSPDPSLLKAGN